ncbi:GNAT family N-acetyltransferase [Ureibacillus acetophenoni]|uniref:Acetyltransferase (GNAT) family protein n=1 Tax=Ureibacillus acetophenoni TaxID=614649 RepID=A0A285UN36_9BACL|nr:GNAT family N-acetyltransferase [Ureibacillus acetophenoni]SOC43232.1 acetyltransferase (GNAT) family protein [Ureibacillus acetophenoni]
MLSIRQIYKEDYPAGKKVSYQYTSQKYYEIIYGRTDKGWNFSLVEENFETPFVKELEEEIFEPYKEGAEVYVAEINGEEAAIMVIQKMEWNNTLLLHDLYVKQEFKKNGIGTRLIEKAKERAVKLGVRLITLETQTSNFSAIQFYLKNGFEIIGFNTMSYTNDDVKNKEVRLEMACIV